MTKSTTIKTISLAAIVALTSSVGSTAFAYNSLNVDQGVSAAESQYSVSKIEARKLVKKILHRDFRGHGLKAFPTHIADGKWLITIKYNVQTVGGAYVDATTGRVSPMKPPQLGN